MAGYIAEVLATAEEMQLAELDTKMKHINEKLSLLKLEVKSTLENKYMNFIASEYNNKSMIDNSRMLSLEVEECQGYVEKHKKRSLINSAEELKNLDQALTENTLCIKLCYKLLELDMALEKVVEDREAHRYISAAETLNFIHSKLVEINKDTEFLDLYMAITSEMDNLRCKCINDLTRKWEKYITWPSTHIGKEEGNLILKVDVKIKDNECIQALHLHDYLTLELKKFADKFYNDVLHKIMTKNCKVVIIDQELLVSPDKKIKNSSCIEVLNNLTIALNYIAKTLRIDLFNGETVITLLAKLLSHDFLQFLIKHCLSKSVPLRSEDLENYNTLIKTIIKFNEVLVEMDFITKDDSCILKFTVKIETLSANEICQYYLETARNIMKKDLSNMEEVRPEDEDYTKIQLTEPEKSSFPLPLCQISTSTKELLDLVDEVLNASSKNTGFLAIQLFHTARNIFMMYCRIVPEYYRKLIETMPQQSALLYNNCMVLVHKLRKLNIDFKTKLLSEDLNCHIITFVDLICSIRYEAEKVMQTQLLTQSKQLTDVLNDSGLATLSDNPQFPQSIKEAIHQCLEQLAILQQFWQHVLPKNVYCKNIGSLCNTLVKEIIRKIITAKDISNNKASQLVSVLIIVQDKGPLLFSEPKEIQKNTKYWNRFCELIWLLQANLLQIEDRWSEGKGALAVEFKPEEIKQMVQTLFQASDERTNLLEKLK